MIDNIFLVNNEIQHKDFLNHSVRNEVESFTVQNYHTLLYKQKLFAIQCIFNHEFSALYHMHAYTGHVVVLDMLVIGLYIFALCVLQQDCLLFSGKLVVTSG